MCAQKNKREREREKADKNIFIRNVRIGKEMFKNEFHGILFDLI